MAQLLYGLAKAHLANGQERQAAGFFRQALQHLDATEAEQLRAHIEAEVLHTTGRFLGQEHIAFLLEHAGRGGFRGDTQDVVILFSDIRDFTHISEGFAADPGALITFLNDYLGHMTLCVERCHGMVDKFIGDAVMAVFSLPVPHPDTDAERAVLAALMMREELERFNRKLPPGTPRLATGIGLHTGPVVAGLIGSPQKRSYTVIGDAVNTASRLESLTKHLGASILISDEVSRRLPNPDRFLLRPLGSYRLKGKDTPVVIADVMGEDDGSSFVRPLKEEIAQVGEALQRLQTGDFAAASAGFAALAAHVGHIIRARGYHFLADTARAYSAQPPDAWDGVIEMVDK
jgi:adenylate cyclase